MNHDYKYENADVNLSVYWQLGNPTYMTSYINFYYSAFMMWKTVKLAVQLQSG